MINQTSMTGFIIHAGVFRPIHGEAALTLSAHTSTTRKTKQMNKNQIEYMVQRFLNWKLPENFNPDGGVSYQKYGNEGTPHQYRHQTSGTNLFDYVQAMEMIKYIIDGTPSAPYISAEQGMKDCEYLATLRKPAPVENPEVGKQEGVDVESIRENVFKNVTLTIYPGVAVNNVIDYLAKNNMLKGSGRE